MAAKVKLDARGKKRNVFCTGCKSFIQVCMQAEKTTATNVPNQGNALTLNLLCFADVVGKLAMSLKKK